MAKKRKGTKRKTKSSSPSSADHTLLLTEELFYCVFEYLPSFPIFQAGRVCRRWRRIAQSHPWYYANIVLDTEDLETWSDFEMEGLQFSRRVYRACLAGLRIYPIVRLRYDPYDVIDDRSVCSGSTEEAFDDRNSEFDIVHFLESRVLDVLSIHMAYVVRLLLNVPLECYDVTMKTLALREAPCLEWLLLGFQDADGEDYEPGLTLPADLFKGDLPNLKMVRLEAFDLTSPLRILAHATDIQLSGYSTAVLPYLASSFPLAERFTFFDFDFDFDFDYEGDKAKPARLGERVEHILFDGTFKSARALDSLDQLLQAHPVPSIAAHFVQTIPNMRPFLRHMRPPFNVYVGAEVPCDDDGNIVKPSAAQPYDGESDTILEVRSLTNDFRRTFRVDSSMERPLFDAFAELAPYIETLSVADALLPILVKSCDSLPELKTLTLDMDFPTRADTKTDFLAFWNSMSLTIPCPRLETVRIVCTRYKAQLVDSGAIHLLGRFGVHLGGNVTPRLVLQGVEMRSSGERTAMQLLAMTREVVTHKEGSSGPSVSASIWSL